LLSSETAFKKDAAVLFLPWSLNNVSICASMCSFNNSSAFALLLPVSRLSVYHLQFLCLVVTGIKQVGQTNMDFLYKI
jgi:hypothetical protein